MNPGKCPERRTRARVLINHDDALRLIGRDQSNGEKIRYTLDNAGRTTQTQTFDAQNTLATTSSSVYDGLNRVLLQINASGKITNYTYDANGNVTTVVDPNNLTTATQYDALNRPILVTDPNLKTIATSYTPDDKVAAVIDPNSNTTSYTYNGFGEQLTIQSPDTGGTVMTYNEGGLIATKLDARGKTTAYTYDVLNRVTSVVYNDGGITQTYDVATNGVGRLASVTDLSGSTTYTYDSAGRVASMTSFITGVPSNRVITYGRDSLGRVTSITYPGGNVVGMTYAQGRVTNMTLNGAALISAIDYFPLGGPESWLLGPNLGTSAIYMRSIDLNSRLEKYTTPTGNRKLTFDNASRITGMGDYIGSATTPSATQTFGYDNVGRLTSFSGFTSNGNASANITQTQTFTYDNNGNRLTSVLNGVTSSYGYQAGNNRLTSVTGGMSKTNTYDLAGNLTNDGSATMTYDARGRMIAANASGLSTSYLINYQNLRVKKSNTSETRYFVYDDAGHMMGEYDAAGNVVQELVWLGDTMVAVRGTMPCLAGGTCTETGTAYVWADHLNTPRELTRVNASNQHISIWKWDSLPFGETTPNANPSNLGVITFNHRFPGQYKDSETGLHQNWNRDYDPKLGRYVESDPLGLTGGVNTYLYVGATPVLAIDPRGLDLVVIVGGRRNGSGNIFGHISIGVCGSGIYSFGTQTPYGSSIGGFITSQSTGNNPQGTVRDQSVYVVKTSALQDASALKSLKDASKNSLGVVKDNCADRTANALIAGGVFTGENYPSVATPGDVKTASSKGVKSCNIATPMLSFAHVPSPSSRNCRWSLPRYLAR